MAIGEPGVGVVFTVGHSTRTVDQLAQLLAEQDVELLCDIRTVPKSRHNPQFHVDRLPAELAPYQLSYTHLSGLGGWRAATAESPNDGWRNTGFRNYADYMLTDKFTDALDGLLKTASQATPALMCAEAVPWRCHRWLVADALLVRDVPVRHILGPGQVRDATLTSFAQVNGTRITYPMPD